jgi:small subunit ribosomal protein S7e
MSAAAKIAKVGAPDETDLAVAQALYDLETSAPDLRKELRPLQFNSAREVRSPHNLVLDVETDGGRSMFLQARRLLSFSCLSLSFPPSTKSNNGTTPHTGEVGAILTFRLTRELEKKFSDRHVVFIGQRRIMRKPGRYSRQKQPRPMSRTLTNVHEKILEDLVFPTEIVGKRTRVCTDGRKIIKVYSSRSFAMWCSGD